MRPVWQRQRRPRRRWPDMGRNVKWNKKLGLDWPNKNKVMVTLGNLAADFLETRINDQGVDADGHALPEVSDRAWMKRGKTIMPSYQDAKALKGGHPWKGSSFTGAMWKSLTIKQAGSAGKPAIKLYFAGSTRSSNKKVWAGPDLKSKLVDKGKRFRNRDKARLLQYANRVSGMGFEPSGKRQFELMAFSSAEKLKLAAYWLSQCRLLKPA